MLLELFILDQISEHEETYGEADKTAFTTYEQYTGIQDTLNDVWEGGE